MLSAFCPMQVNPTTFLLYPDLCPAGYSLVLSGQVNFSVNEMECQCDKNNSNVINCENDQDKIVIRVRDKIIS